ncbi:hypothetical protein [Lutimonas sp.]|uniref:hypothetical protein n=1 Tax=Lutimonas sp. TaxID=1872403 RepID=UPI003D9B51FC
MRQKTNNIRRSNRYNRIKGSFLWVLLLFSYWSYGQKIVEKRIDSQLDNVLIEFDLIDHIEVFSSTGSEIVVRAEGELQTPKFQLSEQASHIVIQGHQQLNAEETFDQDKVCSVEPNYASYKIYIPENKVLFISFKEGNFYADAYDGVINLKVEDGIVKLNRLSYDTHIELNTGSVFVKNMIHTDIFAKTNLGTLVTDLPGKSPVRENNIFEKKGKETDTSLIIRAIMANIYLYESKG